MSGTLYVVATPIGNLEDITLRALRILRESNVVAAEDTRRTAKLFSHYGIRTPTLSFHQHNSGPRLPGLLDRLESGQQVALVSDAGSPGVSDPGTELVRGCIERGIPVDPIPGPSAPLTAVLASGFPVLPLTIFGFTPSRSKDRSAWLLTVTEIQHTVAFCETPRRIASTLAEIGRVSVNRPIILARELTKVYQEFRRGTASELAATLEAPRGEFTVVLGPAEDSVESVCYSDDESVAREFGLITESGRLSRREAVVSVAQKLNQPVKAVYAAIERHRKSVKQPN
jgi:16S rRNA (cytidine1402-2'-O)-methyltransferase